MFDIDISMEDIEKLIAIEEKYLVPISDLITEGVNNDGSD